MTKKIELTEEEISFLQALVHDERDNHEVQIEDLEGYEDLEVKRDREDYIDGLRVLENLAKKLA